MPPATKSAPRSKRAAAKSPARAKPAAKSPYAELIALLRTGKTLASIQHLLNWDQETYMPAAAAAHRADQQAAVAALAHERATDPKIGKLLSACEKDAATKKDPLKTANLREIRRDFARETKLPTDLVAELTRATSQAQEVWKEAREKNDFAMFVPALTKVLDLTRQKAKCLGAPKGGELYDALLDQYEPGAKAAEIEAIFKPLAARLAPLIAELTQRGTKPSDAPLHIAFDAAKQHELGQYVLKAMGFDFGAGRLDTTTHPFCSGMAPGDTRLTTRYRGEKFCDSLYGTMHEGGHGLYEQGLPKTIGDNGHRAVSDVWGSPLADSISLGIHESQSRMWENFVGRSRQFWEWVLPEAKRLAAPALDAFSVDDMHRAANIVSPSYIRVEADEATYNLHVMLRFELERALIAGTLAVKDLPGEWNRTFKKYLGIDPPDDRRGCLQDVHWSFGLVGYFPTYTLGNLYAAQLWETINQQIPDLDTRMSRGDFAPLKKWLNENIHRHGQRYRAGELCQKLTGKPLSADPLMRHLEGKLRPIYGV